MYDIVYKGTSIDPNFILITEYLTNKGYADNVHDTFYWFSMCSLEFPIFIWIDTSNKKYIVTVKDIQNSSNLSLKYITTLEELKEIIEPNHQKCVSSSNTSFKDAIKPGYIVELKIEESIYFGIILSSKTIVYMNKQGAVKGYINNYTETTPHKIIAIYKPTSEHFKLSDYLNMPIVWKQAKLKIKRSKSEIEKELGLEPGTLEIY